MREYIGYPQCKVRHMRYCRAKQHSHNCCGTRQGSPPTASTSVLYLDPKYFWKMAGTPAHLEQGRPMSVPLHVSVMLSP